MTPAAITDVVLDGAGLSIDRVYGVACGDAKVSLSPDARARMGRTQSVVADIVKRGDVVYGVTTGFGKLSEIAIPLDRLAELQVNLVRSHAAGVGPYLPVREVRAMMLLRANVLAKGFSGARPDLVDLLAGMLNEGLHPPIHEQGSVGASGDLAPLAALGLALIGEGELLDKDGSHGNAGDMLRSHGLAPLTLGPKEGITLINGTQAHTAIAALAINDAMTLWRTAHVAGAMSLEALLGTPVAFDARIQDARGQSGQSSRPRCFAIYWMEATFARVTATEIRAFRMPTVCDACHRCMGRYSMRSSGSRTSLDAR
jgi:Histidine ammonia-lyase